MDVFNRFVVRHIVNYLDESFKPYVDNAEEHLLDNLQNEIDVFEPSELVRMSDFLGVPLILAYILFFIMVISLLAFVIAIAKTFCVRKIVDSKKSGKFYFRLVVITLILMIFICGISISTQAYLELDKMSRKNIHSTKTIIENFENGIETFQSDLVYVNSTVISVTKFIKKLTNILPKNIYNTLTKGINDDIEEIKSKFRNNTKQFKYLHKNSGITYISGNFEHEIEIFYEFFQIHVDELQNKLNLLRNNTKEHNISTVILEIQKNMAKAKNITFPNWHNISNILNATIENHIHQIYKDLNFVKKYQYVIKETLRNETTNLLSPVRNFTMQTHKILKDINLKLDKLFPLYYRNYINNIKDKVDISLPIFDEQMGRILQLSTLILMLPNVHSLLICVLTLAGLISICADMHSVRNKPVRIGQKLRFGFSVALTRITVIFGLSMMWLNIAFGMSCYVGDLALNVACSPIVTNHLYNSHFDNEQVWLGRTWLDKNLESWGHNYKLSNIVDKCTNSTIFRAFEVEKYWSIHTFFETNNFTFRTRNLDEILNNALRTLTVPDGEIIKIVNKNINSVINYYNNTMRAVGTNVEIYQNVSIKQNIEYMIKKIADKLYLFHENVHFNNSWKYANYEEYYSADNLENKKFNKRKTKQNINELDFEYYNKMYHNLQITEDIFLDILLIDFKKINNSMIEFIKKLNFLQDLTNKTNSIQKELTGIINKNLNTVVTENVNSMNLAANLYIKNIKVDLINDIEENIGNCSFLPFIFHTIKNDICKPSLTLDSVWIISLINALLMCLILILYNNTCNNFVSYYEKLLKRRTGLTSCDTMAQNRLKKGTLLFDRSGNFMGNSINLINEIIDTPSS